MPHRDWLDRIEVELARRGVPVRFRRRLRAELRDHAEDLKDEEGVEMSEELLQNRLGRSDELAARAADEYRRATWVARHPALVFGALPLPAVLSAFVATLFLLSIAVIGLEEVFGRPWAELNRPAVVAFAYASAWFVRLVPCAAAGVGFTRLYLRHGVSRWWFAAAAVQVLLFAGSLISVVRYSDEPGQSEWLLGFAWLAFPTGDGWIMPFLPAVGWGQVVNVAAPLVAGMLILRAARRRTVLAVAG